MHRPPFNLVRFVPSEPFHYLEEATIAVAPRNLGRERIIVQRVELEFQTDIPNVQPRDVMISFSPRTACELGGKAYDILNVPFKPSLLMTAFTNCYAVSLTYARGRNVAKTLRVKLPDQCYVIIKAVPSDGSRVFVSFKDPQDEALARMLETLLGRAGYEAYLARNDPRPGIDFWKRKIEPAIRSSEMVAVIWTTNTQAHMESVAREIKIAKSAQVPVMVFLEEGVTAPPRFPVKKTEYTPFSPQNPAIAFAAAIENHVRLKRSGRKL
jgi:hypothetical protein